mgnify:CR=1 FL=1
MLVLDDITPLIRAQKVAAWREILPALLRQARDPSHFVRRPLQSGVS